MHTTSFALYKRLLSYSLKFKTILICSLVAVALAGIAEASLSYILKPILDKGFIEQDKIYMRYIPFFIIGTFLLMSIFSFLGNVGMQWVAQRVVVNLRTEMFEKILKMPVADFDKQPSGVLLSKLTYDVTQLLTISSFALVTLIKDSATIIGLLVIMFYNNWKLSLAILAVAPLVSFALRKISRRLRKLAKNIQGEMGELNHVVEESIRGHKELRLFNAFDEITNRFQKINKRLLSLNTKIMIASETASPLAQLPIVICIALLFSYSMKQVADQHLTVGEFISVLAAMAMLLNPIKRLTRLNESLQRGLAGAESIFQLIDQENEKTPNSSTPIILKGNIEIKDLNFCYLNSNKLALNKINLSIKAGETIALVGSSGSGKTTLANLLARFYEPSSGEILYDQTSLASINIQDFRKNIAYVSQNVILFADSILNNIKLGQADKTDEEVIFAAKQAHAFEFISELSNGFNTLIGENGTRLSGGQRQRIALARAFLKKAPIIILDEATSNLDNESEYLIQQAMQTLSRQCTTIIIAHRLSTIENADRIIVMRHGDIVEIGSHQELLTLNKVYANLYLAHEKS